MSKFTQARTVYGHLMDVDPKDHIGRAILEKGIYEGPAIELLLKLVRLYRLRRFLDVGANIGNHALALGQAMENVWCFEPNPVVFQRLTHHIELNRLNHVHPVNAGLSNRDDEALLFTNVSGNVGASTLGAESRLVGHDYSEQPVALLHGDRYVEQAIERPVDLIKIDVEGHEPQVLDGLAATIERDRPVIVMEWKYLRRDREYLANNRVFRQLLSTHIVYLIVSHIERRLWSARPLGTLRRLWQKRRQTPHLVLAPYDPFGRPFVGRHREMVLIPRDRIAALNRARLLF